MERTYFITGFPGFISKHLLLKILDNEMSFQKIYLLILPNTEKQCRDFLFTLDQKYPDYTLLKIELLSGDITKKNFGLNLKNLNVLFNDITDLFHLAAIYDLAVPKKIAYEVNVKGTINVNEFALKLNSLKRYTYFSTSYVSGTREGRIYEHELEMGQTFKNFYEETKYYAEIEVEKLKTQLPITIIRPGIVVGHSETGETSKFDGPYFILNFFTKLRYLPIPQIGKDDAYCNFIPIDYLINAVYYLSHAEIGVNKTYQITDPSPYLVQDVYKDFLSYYLNKTTVGIIPIKFIRPLLSIPFIRQLLKVEKEVLSYFNCKSEYDCMNTLTDLQNTNIKCPDFKDILPVITNYYNVHKSVIEKHVLIR